MSRAELMSKSISRLTLLEVMSKGLDTKLAKTARGITDGARYEELYSEEEKDIIVQAIQTYRESYSAHIFIHEGIGDIGIDEIRERVARHKKLTGEPPIVVVDYLQILAPYDARLSDKQNTDKAVLELKRISRDFKTPVIGISSLNRAGYNDEIKLEAFKESGAIEYGSDVLIGLQFAGAGEKSFSHLEAKSKDPRDVELVILKNRNGSTGDKVVFQYYPLFNYFTENLEANVIQPKSSRKK
jgi:replicative DNA helicase